MKTKIILIFFYLFLATYAFSQDNKEEIYIFFDEGSTEIFKAENGDGVLIKRKKFRKNLTKSKINFYIGNEVFGLKDFKNNIDTCNAKDINKLKFKSLKYMNEKYKNSKSTNFFKNSVFDKIYLVERKRNGIIRYEVNWITDLIEN